MLGEAHLAFTRVVPGTQRGTHSPHRAMNQAPKETQGRRTPMWKQLWKKWTLDKPAAFGDLLWEVFVVQLAAFLDRLTLRQVIAFIPVVILVLAYSHNIPIPPELMLVGDVLAYIDIYSAILLLGLMSRVTTILFALKQAAALIAGLASNLLAGLQRLDFRHRREGGARRQKKADSHTSNDDEPAAVYGLAWA